MSKLALRGGEKAVNITDFGDMFKWPIVNKEMEDGIVKVLREGNMSGTNITKEFEARFAEWNGTKYALAHSSGTASLQSAMFGVGVGYGDEVICPSITYWASGLPAMQLGATVVFCDIDKDTLCIDLADFEKRITPRTKAVVVVHYCAYPAPMDEIMAIARKHNIKVIEDVSHAQGGYYKGKKLGTFGDVAAMSLMSGKSFAIGEGGILVTDDREVYERAMLWGHYERAADINLPGLKEYRGLPAGGYKYRMHQMSSIVGLEQLKKYDAEIAEIDQAMNYFWDKLEGVPGLRSHRPTDEGSTKAGWYCCKGIYCADELHGLSMGHFCTAIAAEGAGALRAGCNSPLHQHPVFNTFDIFNQGAPKNVVFNAAGTDALTKMGELPNSEAACNRVFNVPWFKKFRPEIIDKYVDAVLKVVEHHEELLSDDPKEVFRGAWFQTARR